MKIALEQAREGRLHILGEMSKALTGHRGDVAGTAPRISVMNVPKEKIRDAKVLKAYLGGKLVHDAEKP